MPEPKNLRYQIVTLYVPYQQDEESSPDEWDWHRLADTVPPTICFGGDPLPAGEARSILRANGFAEDAERIMDDDTVARRHVFLARWKSDDYEQQVEAFANPDSIVRFFATDPEGVMEQRLRDACESAVMFPGEEQGVDGEDNFTITYRTVI